MQKLDNRNDEGRRQPWGTDGNASKQDVRKGTGKIIRPVSYARTADERFNQIRHWRDLGYHERNGQEHGARGNRKF